MSDDETESKWKPDEASLARTAAALAEVDARHAAAPRCGICGQRSWRLDEFGLCSKVSPSHIKDRSRVSFR
jgi:hypothetical protein